MAMTPAERQRKKRERDKERNRLLGMKAITLDLAAKERDAIAEGAARNGYEDQTEYLLALVYADHAKVQKWGLSGGQPGVTGRDKSQNTKGAQT